VYHVPLQYELKPGYLSHSADPRNLVAEGKDIFQYRFKPISTLYCQNEYVSKIFEGESQADDKLKEAMEKLNVVLLDAYAVDNKQTANATVNYMVPLINCLLRTMSNRDWHALRYIAFETLVNVVDTIFHQSSKYSLLESYTDYYFANLTSCQPIHEVLPQWWIRYISEKKNNKSFQYCWFFFSLIYKSVVLYKEKAEASPSPKGNDKKESE